VVVKKRSHEIAASFSPVTKISWGWGVAIFLLKEREQAKVFLGEGHGQRMARGDAEV